MQCVSLLYKLFTLLLAISSDVLAEHFGHAQKAVYRVHVPEEDWKTVGAMSSSCLPETVTLPGGAVSTVSLKPRQLMGARAVSHRGGTSEEGGFGGTSEEGGSDSEGEEADTRRRKKGTNKRVAVSKLSQTARKRSGGRTWR